MFLRRSTAREVAPWVATIERLGDYPGWEAVHRARALAAAGRFALEVLAERYLDFFTGMASELCVAEVIDVKSSNPEQHR